MTTTPAAPVYKGFRIYGINPIAWTVIIVFATLLSYFMGWNARWTVPAMAVLGIGGYLAYEKLFGESCKDCGNGSGK